MNFDRVLYGKSRGDVPWNRTTVGRQYVTDGRGRSETLRDTLLVVMDGILKIPF